MPHIKAKPFLDSAIDELIKKEEFCKFRAIPKRGAIELLGVEYKGNSFLLEIKKAKDSTIIRADKVSRPLNVEIIKEVLKKIAKEANLTIINSNLNQKLAKANLANRFEKQIEDFEGINFSDKRVALEVGFGSGRHLLYRAKNNPNTLFIGVEIHTPSIRQLLRQIELNSLENIWVVNYDARLLLEMLPSNSLEKIFIHFPVPWDKKPHRRVISDSFLNEAIRVLAPDGELELRTDSDNYYKYSLEVFSRPKRVSFKVEKNRDLEVISKYEARWRQMGKDIYTLTLISQEKSEDKNLIGDFKFNIDIDESKVSNLPKEAIVKDDYFIHFGKEYRFSDSSGGIIECSFGSFERPEHKYLIYKDNTSLYYYPQRPVATSSNLKAHKAIEELLNV